MMAQGFHSDVVYIRRLFVVVWTTVFTSLASCHSNDSSSYAAFSFPSSLSSSHPHNFQVSSSSGVVSKRSLDLPSRPQHHWNSNYRPFFEPRENDRNVTAQVGKSTFLRCRIKQITDETVSWVRQKDLHIISAGEFVYTSDHRFKPKHTDNTDEWYLHIQYAQKDDAGVYECQVSTEPKMSLSFNLHVVEGQSQIREGKKIVAESGSSVNITCIIDQTTSPPLFVYWYRNDNVLNYRQESVEDDEDHRRLRVYTTSSGPTTTISKLEIKGIVSTDAGNYSCRPVPQYTDPANITLHVLNGESTAAIQRNQRNALTSNTASIILLGFIIKKSLVSFTT